MGVPWILIKSIHADLRYPGSLGARFRFGPKQIPVSTCLPGNYLQYTLRKPAYYSLTGTSSPRFTKISGKFILLKTPEIPENEKSRLETLRSLNILDTPVEERFDRLTRMAKRVFGVPIALVSLVDENRQWFKSCVGLDVSETPRGISFCGHAILGDEIFIIPDASKDDRFSDNPMVLDEPYIRFYAGCPLSSLDGSKLGTLCIIDKKPRSMDREDMQTLRDLASMAERELAAVQMATADELTGILNRRGFIAQARASLSLNARKGTTASLVFLDLNKFKPINDMYGHAEGDRALVTFARQMKTVFRDSDLYARFGGDEFVALLNNCSKQQAEKMVARLAELIETIGQEESRGYDLSFSSGVVEYNAERHNTIEALLAEGDATMYKRKKQNEKKGQTD